jgi:hypothetical protein
MKKLSISVLALAAIVAGCAVGCAVETPGEEPTGAVDQAITSFEFDSTALSKITPPASIPSVHLTLDKLDALNVTSALLGTTEKPERVSLVGNHETFKTSTWELEKDAYTGRIFGLSNVPSGAPAIVDESRLQRLALGRLFAFGIGSGEIGRVLQRKSMIQDFDGTTPDKPELHGYKTFAFRAIGGIQVVGHRAVVTHGVDGVVRRVTMKWPALAAKGHLLHTILAPKDVEARATSALARAGETTGKVYLHWQYQPVVTATGEVTLKLVAAARMRAVEGKEETEEPRTVEVDVSATE